MTVMTQVGRLRCGLTPHGMHRDFGCDISLHCCDPQSRLSEVRPHAMEYSDHAVLPWSCRQLFDLVVDVERYPEFLPHWREVRILASGDRGLYVQQRLDAGPVPVRFRTRVACDADRRIHIATEDGPLRGMEIEWCFEPAGEGHCRVALRVQREPVRGMLRGPLEALLTRSSRELLPLFRQRARALYG